MDAAYFVFARNNVCKVNLVFYLKIYSKRYFSGKCASYYDPTDFKQQIESFGLGTELILIQYMFYVVMFVKFVSCSLDQQRIAERRGGA